MAIKDFLFTSESVSEGHPDKICDQISDAILDAHLTGDPDSRVACETLAKTGMIVIAGEITSRAKVSYNEVAREVVRDIGYTDSVMGFDGNTCAIISAVERQSPDISQGVTAFFEKRKPETVLARLREMRAVTGMSSLVLHYPPYYGIERALRSLTLFATEVMPHLREDAAKEAQAAE